MAIKAAELQVVIGADTNPAVQGIKGAMGAIGNAASTALGVFSGMLMTQAIGALGNLASAGIQAVGEFERISATLGTLVRRDLARAGESMDMVGEKTQQLLAWVQQLAKESPFDATGVTMALRTAMAYGFTAEQAQRLTKATIDFAAGSGQGAEVMNSVALALGQIQAKGKLAGQEMLQLVNAGIDVRDALSQHLGKTTQEVAKMLEKGMIDANTAIEAVVSTLEKDFGGAAREQSLTVSGLISTFDELKQLGLRELFMGIVEAVRPLAGAFLDWLQEEGIARMREIGQSIGQIADKIAMLVFALMDAGPVSIEFREVLESISPKAAELYDAISPFIEKGLSWIAENGDAVKGALTGIAVAFGAMAVVSVVTGLVAALANPLMLIIALAGLLGAAWSQNWLGIRDKTAVVWEWLKVAFANVSAWLQTNIPVALNALRNAWQTVWQAIQQVIATVFPIIQSIWQAFRAAFEGDWYTFGAKLREAWDALWKLQIQILSNAWSAIKSIVSDLINSIKNFFTQTNWGAVGRGIIEGIAKGITSGISVIKNAAMNAAKAALDAAKGFLGIKSPSTVFEKVVAGNMMEGWMRGIQRMTPQLALAVEGASRQVVSSSTVVNNYYNLSVSSLRSSENLARDFLLMGAR